MEELTQVSSLLEQSLIVPVVLVSPDRVSPPFIYFNDEMTVYAKCAPQSLRPWSAGFTLIT